MPLSHNAAATVRFLIVNMLGAYTALNILLLAVGAVTSGWPILLTTAVTVPPMVLAMIYLVVPFAQRVKHWPGNKRS